MYWQCAHWQLNIPDIRHQDIKDGCFKKAIFEHHYLELNEKIAGSNKMMKHQNYDFRNVQGYMKEKSIEKSRIAFKIRCEMIPEIKWNFKYRYRRKGGEEALKCQQCSTGEIESQSHCLVCPRWESIINGLELHKLDDMVILFQILLVERLKRGPGSHWAAQQVSWHSWGPLVMFICSSVLLNVTRMYFTQHTILG